MVLIGMWLVTESLAIGQPTTQQKTSIPVLTREQAEAKALEANYGITLQKILTTSAEVNVNRGLAGQLPTVTMGAAQTYSNNSIQQEFSNPGSSPITRSGAGTTVTTGNVTLNWTLFDGIAMFINYDRLKLMRDLEQEQGRATVELTMAQVRLAFDNLLLQDKKRALLEATLALSKDRMALADQRYQVGTGSKLDLLNSQVDYNTDRTALMAQEQQCTQAQADLNVLLALPSETPFIAQGDLALKDSIIETNLPEQLKSHNNNLKLARFQREVAWQGIKLANSARYPQLNLQAGFNYSDQSFQAGLFKRNSSYGPIIGLNATYNLFNGNRVSTNIKQAELNAQFSDVSLAQVEQQQIASLYNALLAYKYNRKLAKVEGENLTIAKQNTSIALDRYKVGLARPIELREAQRNEVANETRLLEAQFRVRSSEIEILRLVSIK